MSTRSSILVIGAGGYLGSIIAECARARGLEVTSWYSSSEDEASWLRRIRGGEFTAIINAAATTYRSPEAEFLPQYWRSNVDLPVRVAQAGLPAGALLVHVGTRWSLGANGQGPNSLYGATKLLGEFIASSLVPRRADSSVERGRIRVVRVRDIMGPADTRHTVARALLDASKSGALLDMTPGDQLIDPIGARDVAEALLALAADPGGAQEVHPFTEIGLEPVTVRQFVDEWCAATGLAVAVRWGARPYRGPECFEMTWIDPVLSTFLPRPRRETLESTTA